MASPGLIELKLTNIHQMFHALDPSPFTERDLTAQADQFIVDWATEYSRKDKLTLRIHVDEPLDPTATEPIQNTVRTYYAAKSHSTARRFRQMIVDAWLSLGVGLVFLALCLGAADLARRGGEHPLFQIARESLVIAGWVAMWRPMMLFLYDWWPLWRELQVYQRLSRTAVQVVPTSSTTARTDTKATKNTHT